MAGCTVKGWVTRDAGCSPTQLPLREFSTNILHSARALFAAERSRESHPLSWPESKEEDLLQSENIQLMSLLCNNQCCNTFGNLFLSDTTPCILLSPACMKY